MNKLLGIAGVLILATLVGCAPTTGTNREYDIPITITSNTGTVLIDLQLKVDAASTTDQVATPTISPTTRFQLTEGGSTSSSGSSSLKDVASTLKNKIFSKEKEPTVQEEAVVPSVPVEPSVVEEVEKVTE